MGKIQYVTLDELKEKVNAVEQRTAEPAEVTDRINAVSESLIRCISDSKPLKILTDYDADGICSAYILEKTIRAIDPKKDVEVVCNDRRGRYGIQKTDDPIPDAKYIICDMGCNEIEYIKEKYGEDTLVLDHHLFSNEQARAEFINNPRCLNPHCFNQEDSLNAQYCATGLSYRVCDNILKNYEKVLEQGAEGAKKLSQIFNDCKGGIDAFISAAEKEGFKLTYQGSYKDGGRRDMTLNVEYGGKNLFDVDVYENIYRKNGEAFPVLNKRDGKLDLFIGSNNKARTVTSDADPKYGGIKVPLDLESGNIKTGINEKLRNSVDIVAGIGTVTDMVNVLDEHSFNRQIIKTAIQKINNADEYNTDYLLGNFMASAGIGSEDVTAKKIAFNIGALLNSGGRMSHFLNKNGAQMTYDALSGEKYNDYGRFVAVNEIAEINVERKNILNTLKSASFYEFVESQRFGEGKDDPVAIYILEDLTPPTFCGLIANHLADALDKPAIVFATNKDGDSGRYITTGSGRNVEGKESLLDYVTYAANSDKNIKMTFGGHHDAIGIAEINDIAALRAALNNCRDFFKDKEQDELRLVLSPKELASPETLEKVLALEPLGTGLKLPPVEIEGKLKSKSAIKSKSEWQKLNVEGITVTDWTFSEQTYPKDSAGNIKALTRIEINDFKGIHLEAEAYFNRKFIEQQKSLEKGAELSQKTTEKLDKSN